MTRHYLLECALLADGWANDVLVSVGADGMIADLESVSGAAPAHAAGDAPQSIERVSGIAVPGMANAHSHAFQRAMAGNTEFRASAQDSFWTWRQLMYALANRIEADDLRTVATQLFVEMLKAGYTTVAEFHYLHRRVGGESYAETNELWDAIDAAALDAGIGLTFLPTLYQTGDFGSQPLREEQSRFALATDTFLRAIERRVQHERRHRAATIRTGAAFHSLRAVPPDALRDAAIGLRHIEANLPVHIHVAEQIREVQVCLAHTGQRPIEWLMNTGLPTSHWCLVHATHATKAELKSIVVAGASVCVSITTEANLGDGLFDSAGFLSMGGRLCVGSDSQSTVAPAEELRWMEYQQRLRKKRRAVLAGRKEPHIGTRLWREAALAGARAIGQPSGAIAVGCRADWLVLDDTHPSMTGAAAGSALDHLVFAGAAAAIRDVMVAGRWVIQNRRHLLEDTLAARFSQVMGRLTAAQQRS